MNRYIVQAGTENEHERAALIVLEEGIDNGHQIFSGASYSVNVMERGKRT